MKSSVQIVFRNVQSSAAVEANVRDYVEALEKNHHQITRCQVVIEQRHRRHRQGNLFHVRVSLKIPNRELVVSRNLDDDHAHEDVYVAIRDAFETVYRCLRNYTGRIRYTRDTAIAVSSLQQGPDHA